MALDGVIFDFNGTLFFDSPLHVQAWNEISTAYFGFSTDAHTLETEYNGLPNQEILKKMAARAGCHLPLSLDEYSRRKEALYREKVLAMPGGPHLVCGAEQLFDWLWQQKIPFTIASASIKENIDFFVSVFHLDRWLDPALIVYDDGSYQDKVQMFRDAQKRIGVRKNMLIFEDSPSCIRTASQIPDTRMIVIDHPAMASIYPQFPTIAARIRDFTEALPLVQQMAD